MCLDFSKFIMVLFGMFKLLLSDEFGYLCWLDFILRDGQYSCMVDAYHKQLQPHPILKVHHMISIFAT